MGRGWLMAGGTGCRVRGILRLVVRGIVEICELGVGIIEYGRKESKLRSKVLNRWNEIMRPR